MAEAIKLLVELVATFKRIHKGRGGTPPWAWDYAPSIPLIGDGYTTGKNLLVYASAENLSWLSEKEDVPRTFTSEKAWDRYRQCYAETERGRQKRFFPNVGIQPLTDGGLLTAALYVAQRCGLTCRREPRSFIATAAFSNWCKFTVESGNNSDYAGDEDRLLESLPYVEAELSILKPGVVLLPTTIWRKPALSRAMRRASPETCFVPAYQCNATVINGQALKRQHSTGLRLMREHGGTALAKWMSNLERVNKRNAWRYLAHLDEVMRENSL